ncbi:unnamed protein product [Gadus morhua 'NCC']
MRRTRSRVFITGASPYRRHSGPVSQNSLDAFTQSAPGRPRFFSSCVVVFYSRCPGELGHDEPEPQRDDTGLSHSLAAGSSTSTSCRTGTAGDAGGGGRGEQVGFRGALRKTKTAYS